MSTIDSVDILVDILENDGVYLEGLEPGMPPDPPIVAMTRYLNNWGRISVANAYNAAQAASHADLPENVRLFELGHVTDEGKQFLKLARTRKLRTLPADPKVFQ